MAVDIGGNTSLKWEAGIETRELKKDGREVEKILAGVYDQAIKSGKTFSEQLKENIRLMAQLNGAKATSGSTNTSSDTSSLSAFKQAQLQMQKALQESRMEIERLKKEQQLLRNETEKLRQSQQSARVQVESLKVSEQELKNQYQQGRISLQQYQKQLAENKASQQALNNSLVQGRIDGQNYKNELAKLNLEQKKQAIAIKESRTAMTAANGSYAEAQRRLRELGKEIRNAEGGFANMGKAQRARIKEYAQLNGALQKFDFQMKNHQRNVGNYGSGIGALNSGINGLVGSFASLYSAVATVGRSMTVNSEVADSLSDVQRTAGLTADEASRLAENLKKIDTRTSLKGLIDISVIGGQLGIAKDQLVGFTRAIDQLGVVLAGEITGGAEAVATALGKINGVFKVQQQEGTDTEKALNKTGSAILALGQAGLATGEFLQDFGLRVAGVAQSANISLPTILAYAAVLEETGSSAEVSGTAFNRLVGSLAGNRKEFFRIAQIADASLTLEKFTDVINTDANKALQMFFAGLNKGGTNLTSFNDLIAKIGVKAGPSKNAIVALAQNQELLNTRIAQGTDAYKDGTLAADQFEVKNNNLAGSLAKLGSEFDKLLQGDGIGNKVFKPIIDGLTGTLTYFDKLVSSDSWKEFFVRIDPKTSNVKKFGELAAMADKVGRDNSDDPTARIEYELAQFKEQDDKKRLSRLKAEKGELDKIMTLYKEQLKRDREVQAQFKLKRGDSDQTKDLRRQVQNQAKVFGALYEAQFKKTPIKIEPKKVDNPVTLGDSKEANKKEISSRQALQKRIDELINSSKRKQLTNDEEEIQSVRDKYAAMRVEVNNFYKNNANKGLKVDTSGLTKAENLEIETAIAKQQLERTKQTIDEQKTIFSQFEDYKSQYGQAKAEERFKGEKAEYKTYVDYLKSLQPAESDKSVAANLTRDFLTKELPKATKEANDKAFVEAISKIEIYEQKRIAIHEKYARLRAALTLQEDKDALDESYMNELDALDDANIQKLDAYKELYEGIDSLSDVAAKKAIADAQKMLDGLVKAGKISEELAKEIGLRLVGTRDALISRLPTRLRDFAQSLGEVSSQVGEIDEGFGNMIGTIANVVGSIASIKGIMNDLAKAQKDGTGSVLGSISGAMGIAGSVIGIVSGITKALTSVSQKEREQSKYTYELQLKQTEAVTKALERQIAAIEEAYGIDRLNKYNESLLSIKNTYDGLNKSLNGKFSLSGDAELDKIIKMANEGANLPSFLRDIVKFAANSGQIIDLSKFANGLGDIADSTKTLAELETLLDLGKLDDQTAAVVSNLIKQAQIYKDTLNALKAETTGTSYSEIADSIVSMFEKGTTSAEDFAKNFEDIMKRAIVNTFKRNYLEKELEEFYNKFYDYSSSNGELTTEEIATLEALYNGIVQNGEKRFADLQKLSGIGFSGDTKEASGLTGGIAASLTESTGSELAGLWRGQYDITKKQYAVTVQMNTNLYELTQNSVRQVNQLIAINTNTANTVTEVKNLGVKLDRLVAASGGRTERDPS